ncbi:uncharacterized protein LOC142899751 [Nelusetta ayraudi]|uniref:uncharacterized protein LOC142899751 n=1 Tax=Nelusetta ayraudi TaxID=303726 RepID=UPI003F6FAA19
MLAEGFLRLLRFREERKFAATASLRGSQRCVEFTDPSSDESCSSDSASRRTDPVQAGPIGEESDPGLSATSVSIPGCPHHLPLNPDFHNLLDDCSLLQQYPDLQVAESGRIMHNPLARASFTNDSFASEVFSQPEWSAVPGQPLDQSASVRTDQGYLNMGASLSVDSELAGSQLEPMSNSVLNGLLDKQLDEVYMQVLTDNLARCNSQLGHSLLRGLVPPPQPSSELTGPNSIEASLAEASGAESGKKISYLNTHNLGPCSSNFSSPVLRISEPDPPPPQ